jgi:hypothetical protein
MRLVCALLVLIAGCATPGGDGGDLPAARSSWQGAGYDEVVTRWGAPTRNTLLTDGRAAYTWISETTVSRGSFFPSIGIGLGSGGVGLGTGVTMGSGGAELVRCERTLIFKDQRVVEQTWQGPPGYCSSFRR